MYLEFLKLYTQEFEVINSILVLFWNMRGLSCEAWLHYILYFASNFSTICTFKGKGWAVEWMESKSGLSMFYKSPHKCTTELKKNEKNVLKFRSCTSSNPCIFCILLHHDPACIKTQNKLLLLPWNLFVSFILFFPCDSIAFSCLIDTVWF